MLFREHVLSDVLPHSHNNNDNAHKLFFTSSQNSSQNSTFSLKAFVWVQNLEDFSRAMWRIHCLISCNIDNSILLSTKMDQKCPAFYRLSLHCKWQYLNVTKYHYSVYFVFFLLKWLWLNLKGNWLMLFTSHWKIKHWGREQLCSGKLKMNSG